MQGGKFQRPWKRCSMVPNQGLEVEIAMGGPVPISVSSPCFALRYEVPNFLPRGGPFMCGYAYHNYSTGKPICHLLRLRC